VLSSEGVSPVPSSEGISFMPEGGERFLCFWCRVTALCRYGLDLYADGFTRLHGPQPDRGSPAEHDCHHPRY
jgi:hypothetical protein